MTQAQINRRRALAVVASVPALAAVPALASAAELGGEFAALVRRYFAETKTFNRVAVADGRTDKQNDALAASTYEATLHRMAETPIRSANDALALLDWMEREDIIEHWHNDGEGVIEAMTSSLRDYLAGRAA